MNRSKQSTNSVEMRTFNLTTMTLGALFAFLLLISFSPAHAMRDGNYFSFSLGASAFSGEPSYSAGGKASLSIAGQSTSVPQPSYEIDPGFSLEFAGGRYFGSNFRLEGMLAYSINQQTVTSPPAAITVQIMSPGIPRVTFQANAYYSFIPAPSPHEPFIGFGMGGAAISGAGFAFNLSAGYKYFIKDSFISDNFAFVNGIALGASYRLIGDQNIADSALHLIQAGITLAF